MFCLGLNPKQLHSDSLLKSEDYTTPVSIYKLLSSDTAAKLGASTSHYPFVPSCSFISTSCLAVLLLLGINDVDVKKVLISSGEFCLRIAAVFDTHF